MLWTGTPRPEECSVASARLFRSPAPEMEQENRADENALQKDDERHRRRTAASPSRVTFGAPPLSHLPGCVRILLRQRDDFDLDRCVPLQVHGPGGGFI